MFIVRHSSAGAGKTHALVTHYLGRCLGSESPDAYRRVLALTFTNKAAGEMRERVTSYLEQLADGSVAGVIPSLRAELCAELGLSEEQLQARANRTLHHMIHHWSDVAIGTIDAFTRRVVQPFARDLRMDHDLRMTTEQEHYRDEAVDLLLAQAGSEPALTDLLIALCNGLIEDEMAWRVDKPIRTLAAQLDKEQALEHLAALRSLGDKAFIALDRELRGRIKAFTQRIQDMGRAVLDTLGSEGIAAKDMANGANGPYSFFVKLRDFDRTLAPMGSNTAKAWDKDKWHSAAATPEKIATLDRLAPLFSETLRRVEDLRPELREHAIRCAVQRDLMPSAILHLLDMTLESYKREEGVAFFSDLTRKVATIVQDEPAPFLYERLGERYSHFLIDEFQDTSLLQWQCLLPLVENALSTGGTVLLVGDAKQAIYRWRNGEVRQFINLPRLFRKELLPHGEQRERALVGSYRQKEPLAHNHRSGRAVIDFNNRVFEALRSALPERFREAYAEHSQKPWRSAEGLVRLLPLEERSEDGPSPLVLLTERAVREALADGFQAGDIAVLVRSGKIGAEVAQHLLALGHQVISPDGLRIGGDPACSLVVALLAYLRYRDRTEAARAVQLLAILQQRGEVVLPFPMVGKEHPEPSARLEAWLADHPKVTASTPLTELIGHLIDAIGATAASDAYLLFLLDEAHTFAAAHGPDLAGFLTHWERSGERRAVELPTNASAIRIMTIHTAKGLQFPVVIVPTAEMRSKNAGRDLLWMRPGEVVPELPSALVRPDKALGELEVPEVTEEQELQCFDELNLLYVAFTRPVTRLYAGVDTKSKTAINTALLDFLGAPADGAWTYGLQEPAPPASGAQALEQLPEALRAGWRGHLALRRQAPEDWDPAAPDPERTHGNIVHDLLAQVTSPADLAPAIDRAVSLGELPADLATGLHTQLGSLLSAPGMERFYAPGLAVRNESTLITKEGQALRPDRIVMTPDATHVLDIKTGRPNDKHHDQVRGYIALLKELGMPAVSGHLLYVGTRQLIPVDA